MKKLLYIVAIAFVTSMTITSCTEEEVAPVNESSSNGGNGSDPVTR